MSYALPSSYLGPTRVNGDLDVTFQSLDATAGTGSLNIWNGNLYTAGISQLVGGTNIITTTNPFTVSGSGAVTMNVGGAISLTAAASSAYTVSSGSLTLSASNATTGQVIISSAGPQATNGSIFVNATNATNGQITLSSAGGISQAIQLLSTGTSGGIYMSANALVSIQTTSTSSGVQIATASAGVPVTLGTATSTITIPGNLVVSGTRTDLNTVVVNVKDNFLDLNVGNLITGYDTGIIGRRVQTPQDTTGVPTGEVVSGRVMEFGTCPSGGSTTTVVLSGYASTTDNYYNGWWIQVTTGATKSIRRIKSYVGSTKTATIYATADNQTDFTDGLDFTTVPTGSSTYQLYSEGHSVVYNNTSSNTTSIISSAQGSATDTLQNATVAQYQNVNTGQLTVQPVMLKNQLVASFSGKNIVINTKFAAANLVGTYVFIRRSSGITPSVANGTYLVASATVGTSITVTTSVTVTAVTATASADIDLLYTGALKADYITGNNFAAPIIPGIPISTETVIIPQTSTTPVPLTTAGTTGAYLVIVRDASPGGAVATFSISSNGAINGTVVKISSRQGTNNQRLEMQWPSGAAPQLSHNPAYASGSGNFNYTCTIIGGAN